MWIARRGRVFISTGTRRFYDGGRRPETEPGRVPPASVTRSWETPEIGGRLSQCAMSRNGERWEAENGGRRRKDWCQGWNSFQGYPERIPPDAPRCPLLHTTSWLADGEAGRAQNAAPLGGATLQRCGKCIASNAARRLPRSERVRDACRTGLYLPVPTSCTVCVPTASLIFKVAERALVPVGVKVTVIVQSHPALRLVPHPDFALKSPGSYLPP